MTFDYEKIKKHCFEEFQNSENTKILKKISRQSFGKGRTTYLITGGCGFIGNNLAEELSKDSGNLVVVVDLVKKDFKKLENVLYLSLDLSTVFDSRQIDYSKFDYIFHFAADLGVKNFSVCPSPSFINNYLVDKNLIEILTSRRFSKIPHVVYASTSEVYGECDNASEETNFQVMNAPRGSYACEKLMMEFLLKNYQIPHTIVRFFNVVGRGQTSEHGHVIPTFIERAVMNEDIVLDNGGEEVRSFCDVSDAVEMLKLVKDYDGEFNIGANNKITIKELAKLIIELTKSKSKLVVKEHRQKISFRSPCLEKINKLYSAKNNLKNILKNMCF